MLLGMIGQIPKASPGSQHLSPLAALKCHTSLSPEGPWSTAGKMQQAMHPAPEGGGVLGEAPKRLGAGATAQEGRSRLAPVARPEPEGTAACRGVSEGEAPHIRAPSSCNLDCFLH